MDKQIKVSIVVTAEVEPWIAIGVHDAFWAVGTLWNRVMGESECPKFLPEIVAKKSGAFRTATGFIAFSAENRPCASLSSAECASLAW